MEKSAEYQIKVYKENDTLKMRLPGGNIILYDNRFGNLDYIENGDYDIFPMED